ncbi:MAG: GNAT family N-acetyltransferase [Candidatus Cloacimonetes bacterium]|jgi:RimJ/RimL family protein N-acetyltransferase|nr:GNAT family N-acetyltransferase [Candidatus Cloacimonadota bacterium]MDY0171334.1 GNAT family protein [Candidatus Cloacimonadaceae bacterium]
MENVASINGQIYALEQLQKDPEIIKLFYMWQINEGEKDRFCFQPVMPGKNEYSEDRWLSFLERFPELVESDLIFMLKNTTNNEYLGYTRLGDFNCRNKRAELSYYFPAENRYKGYGTVIMGLCMAMAFDREFFWPLHKIYAETSSYNTPSIRLLENSGFTLDGKIRAHYWLGGEKYDQYVYTLLRSEYLEKKGNSVKIL